MPVKVRLANVPEFALSKYHPNQLKIYLMLTEIIFKVLNLPSVADFLGELPVKLGVQDEIEARVCRIPSILSKIERLERNSVLQVSFGTTHLKTGLISVYPPLLWADPSMEPKSVQDDVVELFYVCAIVAQPRTISRLGKA